jgi:uncharacterized protein with HEPN domain
MLTAARRAVERLDDISIEEFQADSDAGRAPESLRLASPSIPWRLAVSMRNRIVHGYDSIDWQIVYETVRHELNPLIGSLEQVIRDLEP